MVSRRTDRIIQGFLSGIFAGVVGIVAKSAGASNIDALEDAIFMAIVFLGVMWAFD